MGVFQSIVRAMGSIEPPVQLDSAEHETMAKWVVEYATKQGFDYPSEFYQYTKVLWKDRGVQVVLSLVKAKFKWVFAGDF